ncbi:hypothetical protein FAZ19_09490 [Sphingobacterium alkalisoli]|uniref:Uncharacterized protein n=1 Tax=Sphingobacterium alkalisoli TaxID=1874115 RepID=A0A4U0H5W8_9SPHI|nr:hypothetical protein [Sphingobacterium alkalisoli]TJY67110.1 hypothetical protein FAZ19_09490 [Sphingobacterium alkalisoli]
MGYHFPTLTIHKMAKLPFIPAPRYAHDKKHAFDVHRQIREDVSMTQRAPYPQEHELSTKMDYNLQRFLECAKPDVHEGFVYSVGFHKHIHCT